MKGEKKERRRKEKKGNKNYNKLTTILRNQYQNIQSFNQAFIRLIS